MNLVQSRPLQYCRSGSVQTPVVLLIRFSPDPCSTVSLVQSRPLQYCGFGSVQIPQVLWIWFSPDPCSTVNMVRSRPLQYCGSGSFQTPAVLWIQFSPSLCCSAVQVPAEINLSCFFLPFRCSSTVLPLMKRWRNWLPWKQRKIKGKDETVH